MQELRAEVNILLRRAKPPKSHISREEKKALKELKEDQDRMVLTADKGVALVVMDRKEYQQKIEGVLATPAYRAITSDLTNKLKAQIIQKLRRIKRKLTWRKVCIEPYTLPVAQPQSFMGYLKSIKKVPLLGQKYLAGALSLVGWQKSLLRYLNLL